MVNMTDIPGHSSIPEDYEGGCMGKPEEGPASVTVERDVTQSRSQSPVAIRVNEEAEKDLVRNLLLNQTAMKGLDLVAQIANPILGVSEGTTPMSNQSSNLTGLLGAKTFRINSVRIPTGNDAKVQGKKTKTMRGGTFMEELRKDLKRMEGRSSSAMSSVSFMTVSQSHDNSEAVLPPPPMIPPQNFSDRVFDSPEDKENTEDIMLARFAPQLHLRDSRSRSRPAHSSKTYSARKSTFKKKKLEAVAEIPSSSWLESATTTTKSITLTPPTPTMTKMSTRKSTTLTPPVGPVWTTFRSMRSLFMSMRECDFDENAHSNPETLQLDHSKGTAIGVGGYSWVTEYVIIFFPPALLMYLIASDLANACTKGTDWMSSWNVFWALFRVASALFMASCFHAYLHIISTPTIHHVIPLPFTCAVIALGGPLIRPSFFMSRWWCLFVVLGVGSAATINSIRTMLSSGEAFFLSYDLGRSSMGKALKNQIRQNLQNWFVSLADLVTVLWLVYPFIELARVAAEQMHSNWGVLAASLFKVSVVWLQICNVSGMFRDLSAEICFLNVCYPLVRHYLLNPSEELVPETILYTVLAVASFVIETKNFRSSPGFFLIFSLNIWFYGFDGISMVEVLFAWRYMVFWHVFSKFSHWVQRMRHSLLYRMAYCHDMSVNSKKPVTALHSLNCQHFIRFENWFLNFVMHCLKVWDVTILLRMVRSFTPVRYEREELRIRLGTQMLNTSMLLTFTGYENNGKIGVFKFKNMMFPLAAPTVEYLRELTIRIDLKTRMMLDFEGTMDTYSLEMLRFCIHEHKPTKAVAPTLDFIYKLRQKHPQVKRMFAEYERKFHCCINKYDEKISVKTTGWSRMAAMLDTLFAFGTHPVVHGFGGSYEEESLFGTHTHAMTHGNNFLGESSNFVIATLCASHVPVEAVSLSVINNEQNFGEDFFRGPAHAGLRKLENVSLLAKIHNITIDNLKTVWRKCEDAPYKPSDPEFRRMAVYFINNSIMHSLDHALQYKISSFRHYMNDLDYHRYQPAAVSARYLTEQIPGTGERTSNWTPYVGWVQEWHKLVVRDMKFAGIHDPKEAEAKYGLWGDIEDVDLCIDF